MPEGKRGNAGNHHNDRIAKRARIDDKERKTKGRNVVKKEKPKKIKIEDDEEEEEEEVDDDEEEEEEDEEKVEELLKKEDEKELEEREKEKERERELNKKNSDKDDDDDEEGAEEEAEAEAEEEEPEEEEEEAKEIDEEEEEKRRTTTFDFDGVTYTFKERPSVLEEREGKIEFRVVNNDNTRENLMVLTGLKNIFQKQLPKMPREYIARLVYDRSHLSMAVVRKPLTVVGGITYRPFDSRGFAEIVFCAISSTEQVRGYGAHLMNHLKDYVRATSPIKYFLTYADNYAIGYFKKQGFTKEITLDKHIWMGYIKDYEGGTLMQCSMLPKIRYLDSGKILLLQKAAIQRKIRSISKSHIVRPGLKQFKDLKNIKPIDPMTIPGLKESGWTPEMDELAQRPRRSPHHAFMQHLLTELQNNAASWPFSTPVNKEEVPDYYEVIKEPMDLSTMESKLENDHYNTVEDFVYDAKLIFNNCRSYNNESTTYYKNANKLEKFFNAKVKEVPEYSQLVD